MTAGCSARRRACTRGCSARATWCCSTGPGGSSAGAKAATELKLHLALCAQRPGARRRADGRGPRRHAALGLHARPPPRLRDRQRRRAHDRRARPRVGGRRDAAARSHGERDRPSDGAAPGLRGRHERRPSGARPGALARVRRRRRLLLELLPHPVAHRHGLAPPRRHARAHRRRHDEHLRSGAPRASDPTGSSRATRSRAFASAARAPARWPSSRSWPAITAPTLASQAYFGNTIRLRPGPRDSRMGAMGPEGESGGRAGGRPDDPGVRSAGLGSHDGSPAGRQDVVGKPCG